MSGNVASDPVNLKDIEEQRKKLESTFLQQNVEVSLKDIEERRKKLESSFMQQNVIQKKTSDKSSSATARPNMNLSFSSSCPSEALKPNFLPVNQRKKQISFQLPTNIPPPVKSAESEKVDQRLQEAIRQSNNLRIDGKEYKGKVNEFDNFGQIGSGTCGQVYKMLYRPTGHVMAVKQMHKSGNREENKRIFMDLDIVQKSHDCPHIVQCYGIFITDSSVWICMELMETCFDKLKRKIGGPIPENIIGKLCVSVVKALDYLKNKHGVIHRDVKPSNILVSRHGNIKLCDFGISGRLVDSQAKTRAAGCTAYMAPERINPDPSHPNYDIRADVWSLGISLVELATGNFPYQNCKTDFELLTKILEEDPPTLPPESNFSIDFRRFVASCCTKNYQNRPKYKELLSHDFIIRYERTNVAITLWLNTVLGPAKSASLQRGQHLRAPDDQPQKKKDPFAFAGAFNRAQFQKHSRARSWGAGVDFTKPSSPSTSTSSNRGFSIFR